jgi:2,5-dihydroxypyridine 5,6-dioxygenase
MQPERIENKWIEAFCNVFTHCAIGAGNSAAIVSETQSRNINVRLAELALLRNGAQVFHIVMPTPEQKAPVPVRSTGASDALQGIKPVIGALAGVELVVDCTVEGLLHAPELGEILAGGARVLMISSEHPEILERLQPDANLENKVKAAIRRLREAATMHVTSAAGTDLTIDLQGAVAGGGWGFTTKPGTVSHWPGGLCLCFPAAASVNGQLTLAPGDVNLTFKRYLESEIRLTVEKDYVVAIDGDGLDAQLMREYFAAWNDRDAYAVSHVGWGMNPAARWDALTMYDRNDVNGTELRAFAGNFLYSTGANEVAGRHTLGHFDLPLRSCNIELDGEPVVSEGRLSSEFE